MEGMRFIVYGKVQGVFMRKYTEEKAQRLGLVGWSRNVIPDGTVEGAVEGQKKALLEMKEWLSHEGSPMSKIERCETEFYPLENGKLNYSIFETLKSRYTQPKESLKK